MTDHEEADCLRQELIMHAGFLIGHLADYHEDEAQDNFRDMNDIFPKYRKALFGGDDDE